VEVLLGDIALDGLFEMIARQEKSIRQNPAAAATGLAKKVFGAARCADGRGAIAPSPSPVRPAPRPSSRGTRRHRAPAGTAG
ncbi:DUF4197 family protein, partial [Pseudomonas aeruginosa]